MMRPVGTGKDFLTNCYARDGLIPYLKKMEEDYLFSKRPFSVLIMDVDHFKSFNDKYGHLHGDEVLKYFSSSMRLDLEDEENAPFRFGGDEFVMVFPSKSPGDAYRLAGRLRKNIRTRSCLIKGRQISITFSGGIAGYPTDANTIEAVLDRADKALYYSKNHGRGRITKYSDLDRKELLQVLSMVLALLVFGATLFYFREPLSGLLNKATSSIPTIDFKTGQQPLPPKIEQPVAPIPEPQATSNAEIQTPAQATPVEPEISKIYLESGRIVDGVVKSEDEDWVKVEVGLKEGKGMLLIKKSQVLRIETGSKIRKLKQ
jgi:diguanylate cyclase (GGDEF)-like protein